MAVKGRNVLQFTARDVSLCLSISAGVSIDMVTGVFCNFDAKKYSSHFVKLCYSIVSCSLSMEDLISKNIFKLSK